MKHILNKGKIAATIVLLLASTFSYAQTSTPAYTDAQINKIMDKSSYPNYDKDKTDMEKIKTIFYHPGNSYNYKTSIEKLENIKWAKSKIDSVSKAYSEYWKVYKDQMKKREECDYLYELVKTQIKEFEDYIKNTDNGANPVFTVPKQLDDALELAKSKQDIVNSERYKSLKFSEKRNYVKSEWYRVDDEVLGADYQIAKLKYTKGENYEGLGALIKKREEAVSSINALKSELDSKVVEASMAELENIKMPAEVYAGADKATLKKNLTEYWAKDIECKEYKLLKVIFNHAGWERKQGTQYQRNSSDHNQITGTDYNYSFLEVTVIFQRPGDAAEIANMFEAEVSKDNINKTVEYGFICSDERSFKQILTKNVK